LAIFLCSQNRQAGGPPYRNASIPPSSNAGFQPAKSSASSTFETSEGATFSGFDFRPSPHTTQPKRQPKRQRRHCSPGAFSVIALEHPDGWSVSWKEGRDLYRAAFFFHQARVANDAAADYANWSNKQHREVA